MEQRPAVEENSPLLEADADHRTLRVSMWGAFAVTIVSLILGFIGYRTLGLAPLDAFFGTLQMFALDAPVELPADSTALEVARFTAPLALVVATVVAVAAVAGEAVRHAARLRRVKDHVVVLGLSDNSAEFATELLDQGRPVVIVEINGEHPALRAMKRSGAMVVVGDVSREQVQLQARVDRCNRVVISTGDDGLNLRTAETAARLLEKSRDSTVHVLLADYWLHEELARTEFMTTPGSGATIDFVHRADYEAATFMEAVTTASRASVESRLIRFEGDGARGRRTLIHLARRNALLGLDIAIVVDEDTRRSVVEPVISASPWVADVIRQADPGQEEPGVCLLATSDSDGAALGRGLRLALAHRGAEVFVMTTFPTDGSLVQRSAHLHVIPAGSVAVSPANLFSNSWVETLARARHQIYCALEVQRGADPATNASIVPWADLPESLRESNRDFARSISEVLEGIPLRLVPLRGLAQQVPDVLRDRMELLAREEHDRWVRDLERKGWRWGPAPKDPDRLTHPLLIDWSDLPEEEREKDRDSVRSIPTMLALVGMEMQSD